MARRVALLACFLAALVAVPALLPAGASARRAGAVAAGAVDRGVLAQLNRIRAAHGLVSLSPSPELAAAALQHSQDMLAHGYFGHSSLDGRPFWERIEAFYPEPRYGYWAVGENLYWTSGTASPTQGVKAWMASPVHRANILDPGWRQVGIATASAPDAPGEFGHRNATVITTDFGIRRTRDL
jgi:uncharacterized protein YkwD